MGVDLFGHEAVDKRDQPDSREEGDGAPEFRTGAACFSEPLDSLRQQLDKRDVDHHTGREPKRPSEKTRAWSTFQGDDQPAEASG